MTHSLGGNCPKYKTTQTAQATETTGQEGETITGFLHSGETTNQEGKHEKGNTNLKIC